LSSAPEYDEELQAKSIRSQSFYDTEGVQRRYYYYVDLQGRLFLEDTLPKNIATSLKSEKMLDFFFKQIRPMRPSHERLAGVTHSVAEYPWMSPCGKELNLIKAADTAVVFHDLHQCSSEGAWELHYGGSLRVPFGIDKLRMSQSGRLYHLFDHRKLGSDSVGLLRSSVAGVIAQGVTLDDSTDDDAVAGTVEWQGESAPLRWLSQDEDSRRVPSARS
jgi:hypothetical protein